LAILSALRGSAHTNKHTDAELGVGAMAGDSRRCHGHSHGSAHSHAQAHSHAHHAHSHGDDAAAAATDDAADTADGDAGSAYATAKALFEARGAVAGMLTPLQAPFTLYVLFTAAVFAFGWGRGCFYPTALALVAVVCLPLCRSHATWTMVNPRAPAALAATAVALTHFLFVTFAY
jgi:hypothetical protein